MNDELRTSSRRSFSTWSLSHSSRFLLCAACSYNRLWTALLGVEDGKSQLLLNDPCLASLLSGKGDYATQFNCNEIQRVRCIHSYLNRHVVRYRCNAIFALVPYQKENSSTLDFERTRRQMMETALYQCSISQSLNPKTVEFLIFMRSSDKQNTESHICWRSGKLKFYQWLWRLYSNGKLPRSIN